MKKGSSTITTRKVWQKAAQAALQKNFLPPQRYGTAFHVSPPFSDVRELAADGRVFFEKTNDWRELSVEDKKRILGVSLNDVYLTWQVANLDATPLSIFRFAAGRHTLKLDRAGLHFMVLEEGAQLSVIDMGDPTSIAIRRVFIWQKANSQLNYTALRADTAFLNEHIQVELVGESASAEITHVVVGRQAEQGDMSVSVWHKAREAKSQVQVRTVAADKARIIYRGLIDVDGTAVGTQGYQAGRALLLSRQATVDILPQLNIRTNDVKCSHGVNTTHLDDNTLFYAQSRGLGRPAARQLAITGFFHDKLDLPKTVGTALAKIIATL